MSSELPANRMTALPVREGIPRPLAVRPGGEPPASDGPGLGDYFSAIRRHFWIVLLVTGLGVGLAGFAVYRTEPLYGSKTVVQFTEERAAPTGGLAGLAATLGGGGSSLSSQVQVVRSRVVLAQVVDSLGLRLQRKVPGLVKGEFHPTGVISEARVANDATADTLHLSFQEAAVRVRSSGQEVLARYGEPVDVGGVHFIVPSRPHEEELTLWVVSRDDAINELLESVKVFVRDGTTIVDIFATGYDPFITERVANATAELYRRFVSRRSREQAQRRRAFVMQQMLVADSMLNSTQNELAAFRQQEALYSSKSKGLVEQTGGYELEMARSQLAADRQVYTKFLNEMQRSDANRSRSLHSILSSPSIANNPVVMGLYERLSHYESQRDSLTFGRLRKSASDPDVRGMDSLVTVTEGRLRGAVTSNIETLDARISAMDMIRARSDSTLRHIAVTEPQELRLTLRMESISEAAKALRERYYTAGMVEAAELDQVTILDPALTGDIAGTGPLRTFVLGLVFSLMVGGAGAVLVDRANRSVRRRDEVEHLLHVPGLAVIPRLGGEDGRAARRLPARLRSAGERRAAADRGDALQGPVTDFHSLGAEAYRTLRTHLMFAPRQEPLRSIVVTSPSGSEGKTTTAANLAVAYAQNGSRVLLVDCDFRRPRLHSMFGIAREPGLSKLLLGEVSAEEAIRKTSIAGLSVIPSGPVPQMNATDLFDGGVMRSLIVALAGDFEVVILDTPPVLATANAAVLGTQVDGVLVVVRAGQTDRDAAREAIRRLSDVGGRVVGAVLNDPDSTLPRHQTGYEDALPSERS